MSIVEENKLASKLIMFEHAQDVTLGDAFLLITKNRKLILIDTGTTGCAQLIEEEVEKYGGDVDACFLTHQHDDHADGFIALLERQNIRIKSLYWSPISTDFIKEYENSCYKRAVDLDKAIQASNLDIHVIKRGDRLIFDNCIFKILAGGGLYTNNAINNSSLVFSVLDGSRKILFTGDAGEEEGLELMKNPEELECDIVKTAHHGQAGVPLYFYGLTKAKVALFPTAQWLWEWPTTQKTVEYLNERGIEILSVRDGSRVIL